MRETGILQVNPADTTPFDPLKRLNFPEGRIFSRFPKGVRNDIKKVAHGQCEFCGSCEDCSCHHAFPESLGGLQAPANGLYLCASCHREADDMWVNEGKVFDPGKWRYVPIKKIVHKLCDDAGKYAANKNRLIHRL